VKKKKKEKVIAKKIKFFKNSKFSLGFSHTKSLFNFEKLDCIACNIIEYNHKERYLDSQF
jgi:hypothetical protein